MTKNTKDLIELLTRIYANNERGTQPKINIWTKEGNYFISFNGKQIDIEVK